jgi:transcription factor TFIIIB component B''
MRLRPFEVKELAEESQVTNVETTGNSILDDKLAEKDVKDEEGAMPVPQVCLGPEGEILPPKKESHYG